MSQELDEAIAAVSAELESEYNVVSSGEEVKPEPVQEEAATETPQEETPAEEQPTEESAKPERERDEHGRFVSKDKGEEAPAEEEEEEEEPLGLSAEELAAVNADERLARVYKSMQRGLTKKTTGLADIRKQLEERAKVADWIQSDPDAAIRALAAARNLRLAEDASKTEAKQAVSEAADDLEAEYIKVFGSANKDAVSKLRALFEKTAEAALTKRLSPDIEALKAQVEEHNRAAAARGISAAKQEFEALVHSKGGEWSEAIEKEMAQQIGRTYPEGVSVSDNVKINDVLQDAYDVVMYRRSQKSAKRDELKRLRRVKEEQEPTNAVRPAKDQPLKITADMSEKDAVALAIQLAEQEAHTR